MFTSKHQPGKIVVENNTLKKLPEEAMQTYAWPTRKGEEASEVRHEDKTATAWRSLNMEGWEK